MRYHCGHEGCDVCGARTCGEYPPKLTATYGGEMGVLVLWQHCISRAAQLAVRMAREFAGITIDPARTCGRKGGGE